jgi:hypothetical protein
MLFSFCDASIFATNPELAEPVSDDRLVKLIPLLELFSNIIGSGRNVCGTNQWLYGEDNWFWGVCQKIRGTSMVRSHTGWRTR